MPTFYFFTNLQTKIMTQKIVHLAFLLFLTTVCTAQTTYTTVKNLPYYPDSVRNSSDAYLRERCVLDLYYPNQAGFATVIWFHGGGLTAGEKELPEALKNQGIAIVGVNYRLHPNVKAPAYLEDAAAAVAWTFQNIHTFGGDTTKIIVAGHSAGGYLAAMIGLDKHWLADLDLDANRLAAIVPFSGQAITHFTIRKERGLTELVPVVDEYAPLYHVRADAPPLILITGDRDLELWGRYEENAYLERMMQLTGHTKTKLHELGGYGHVMTAPAFPLLLEIVKSNRL
jgi:acetyl esterase/lipase